MKIPLRFINIFTTRTVPAIGDCWWGRNDDGQIDRLYVKLPDNEMNMVRVKQDGGKGGQDDGGYYHSWNGDVDHPSLLHSLQSPGGFHGWITGGYITDENPIS